MHSASPLVPDFNSFVASDHGISATEAERLIQEWLVRYRPQARPPIRFLVPVEEGGACSVADD
jgi:hypothetical protein